MLSFEKTNFRYEPYPIGVSKEVLSPDYYDTLVESFPPKELFEFKANLGNKYSLSERNHEREYHDYVRSSEPWKRFYDWIKREEFPHEVMDMLREHNIDLGIQRSNGNAGGLKGLMRRPRRDRLNARFEFSMLPADQGSIRPHTDGPLKIITLVIAMVRPGEWDPSHGGGTDVVWPRDRTLSFNYQNRYLDFEEVETLDTFEFEPNQCVVFIKTFNSWHAVRPMRGEGSDALRRTLTVNIERIE